jgi:DNA-binding transcriptional LysR family regulator
MDKKRLLETLDALRAEVAQSGEVDPAMMAELRQHTDEIRQADEKQRTLATAGSFTPNGLKNLLLRFEADHPQLSVSVGKVADALAAMGF